MSIIILPLCGALVIVSMADAVRLRNIAFERLYERLLGSLMRESEKVTRLLFHYWIWTYAVAVFSQWRCLVLGWCDICPLVLSQRRSRGSHIVVRRHCVGWESIL